MMAAIVSFFLGLGLSDMFSTLCKSSVCIVINGPPVKDVINKVYQMGEKCVEFTTEVVSCPEDRKDLVKTVERVAS